jgi:beta-lactamase regulating signal transducer with metallopeptidase domain
MDTVINELNKLSFVIAPVFYKLLYLSITACCIGLVILLIRRFADGKISPAWKYTMWLMVLFALAVPYRPHTQFALLDPMEKLQEISYRSEYDQIRKNHPDSFEEEQLLSNPYTGGNNLREKEQAVFLKSLIFDVAIPLLWLAGVVVTALFMLISRRRLWLKLKRNLYETNSKYNTMLLQCKATLGIRGKVGLITQNYMDAPALLGLVRPKIILPLYTDELSDKSVEYILLHELSHYKRLDMVVNHFLLLLQAVYWFNPLIWRMFGFLRQDMELANDACVINRIGSEHEKDYLRSLVEVLSRCSRVSFAPKLLCMVDGKDTMGRRIKMLKLNGLFKRRKGFIRAFSLVIICTASILFLTQSSSPPDITNSQLEENPSLVGSTEGAKLQAFKGLELYVWRNSELTGSDETYFTLLEGTNRNKEYSEIYDLDTATSDIKVVGQVLSNYEDGLYLAIYQMNKTDFTKEQMSEFAEELMKYMPQNSSVSIGLLELPLASAAEEEPQPIIFWVKPDEPDQVIAEVAASQWLNSYMGESVSGAARISDYTIEGVTVLENENLESDDNIEDDSIHVRVQYGITTATSEYSNQEDGISGQGNFDGLIVELYVKRLDNGNLAIVRVAK